MIVYLVAFLLYAKSIDLCIVMKNEIQLDFIILIEIRCDAN